MSRRPAPLSPLLERLRRIASDVLRNVYERRGSEADAVLELKTWLASDTVLRDALAAELLEKAVKDAVRSAAERRPAPVSAQVHALRVQHEASLLNYPLTSGIRLRLAKRDDLEAEAKLQFSTAREYMVLAKWFRAVAASLPDSDTLVQTVLTEQQLRDLRRISSQLGRGDAAVGSKFPTGRPA